MRKQKRQLLKAFIFIFLLSTFIYFIFFNSFHAAAAIEASYTLSGEAIGTMDNKEDTRYWENNYDHRKFNKYIDKIDFRLSSDGIITLSTNTSWKTMVDNNYESGSDYYYDEVVAGQSLLDSSYDKDEWYDRIEHFNLTKTLTENEKNVFIRINNITKGGYLKSYDSISIDGFGNLSDDIYNIRFYIVWSYHTGLSDAGDSNTYYYYTTYWDFQIRLKDSTPPSLTVNGSAIPDNYIYRNFYPTVYCSDDLEVKNWYYTRGTNQYTSSSPINLTSNSHQFNLDGFYTVTATDTSNNTAISKFIVDRTAPTIEGAEEGGYYNTNRTLTFNDVTSGIQTVTINSNPITLTSRNQYVVTTTDYNERVIVNVTDKAGNARSLTFFMDSIAPTINGVSNNAIVQEATITISDDALKEAKYSFSSSSYDTTANQTFTSGTRFTNEGFYYIQTTDKAGNISSLRFRIDKTAPIIDGVIHGEYYNTSKTLTLSDNAAVDRNRFYINGQKITLTNDKYTVSSEKYSGSVVVGIYDMAGNYSTISFTIDSEAPILTTKDYVNFSNGIYYTNQYITISSNENVTFKINDRVYLGSRSISLTATNFENKRYVLTATDKAGNSSSLQIYFDRSLPDISFSSAKENNDTYYSNENQTIHLYSSNSPISSIQYTLNNQTFNIDPNKNSFSVSTPGTYIITVRTLSGNSITKTLIIDKTAPVLNIKSNGVLISNNGWTNNTCTISFSDNVLLATQAALYSYNESDFLPFTNNKTFTEEGSYSFIIYDFAGNYISKKVTIEKILPLMTGAENGYFYNTDKILNFYDADSGIQTVTINDQVIGLTNNSFKVSSISYKGQVNVHVIDNAGNTNDYYFFLDTELPSCNIESGKYYSSDIRISIEDYLLSADSYLQKNQEDPAYLKETKLQYINTSGDGKYQLYLIDKAGNHLTLNFYIDTIPPTAEIKGYTSKIDNVYKANAASSIEILFESSEATLKFNQQVYTSGKVIIDSSTLPDGEYEIIVQDKALNSTTYILDLKSSIPEATISGYFALNNGYYYANNDSNIEISWNDATAKVIINKQEEYRNKFTLICSTLPEGEYDIELVDTYNNSSNYKIIIDKQKDLNNFNFLTSQNFSWKNHYWNTYEYTYSNFNFYPGKNHSFASYEAAQEYARIRETSIYEKIKYEGQNIFASEKYGNISEFYDYENLANVQIGDEVYIYKSISSSSKIVVYFNYANFRKALDYYINSSINEYYRFFDSNSNIFEAYDDSLYYNTFYISASEFTLTKAETSTIIYTSNNNSSFIEQTNKAALTPGINYIKEIDIAGNVTEYTIILNQAPITFSVLNNSNYTKTLKNTQKLYASSPISLILDGLFVEHCIIKVNFTDLNNLNTISYITNEGLNLTEEGTYIIDTYDIFGNKSLQYTIYILYSEEYLPKITSEINKLDGIIIDLTFNISYYRLVSNQITNIIVKFTDINGDARYLTVDGNGNPITTSSQTLTFVESGEYEISLTDIFGNDATSFETLQKGTPFGQLYAGSTAVPSGTITYSNISFQFNPDYEYKCTVNGAAYINGTGFSAEGIYEFILSNADTTATYTIEIDKTAPTGAWLVDGNPFANAKTTASHNVIFTFDEEDATATLGGLQIRNNYLLTQEGKNTILLTDKAGNITEYTITLDYTAPNVTIYSGQYEVENGAVVNQKIKFVWNEYNCSAYLNGILYSSGRTYSTPGTYTLMIQDQWGNAAEYYVILDLSTPEFEVRDIDENILKNNAKINKGFKVSWLDDTYSVYLNNAPYVKETIISSSGLNLVQVINQAGTVENFSVYISYTLPEASIYTYDNQVLSSESMTNKRFYITWNDTKDNRFTCTINNKNYSNGNIIREDGDYTIIINDEYSNSNTYHIIRDTIPPTGSLTGVESGGITNQNVSFSSNEENSKIFLNGLIYQENELITEEGKHQIIIEDIVGNSTTYTFEIDKTAPEYAFTIEPNQKGYINNRTAISWNETNCSAFLNDKTYLSGARIYDGTYHFILIDRAGNQSICDFIVDSSIPSLSINGIDKNGNSNSTVTIEWIGDYHVLVNDISIENGTQFTEDGFYNVLVTSASGNTNTYTFEISTVPPIGTLIGVENGKKTNGIVSFHFDATNNATLNGKPYFSGDSISKESLYTLVLSNKFGNSTTYTFEIDKTAPLATLNGVTNGKATNLDVIIEFDETDAFGLLNADPYIANTIITEEGKYEFIISDSCGNTNTYTFEIDKTAPECQFQGVEVGSITNQTVYVTWSELNCSAFLDDKLYTSGYPIREEGVHKFEIKDYLGNSKIYSFEIDKTAPEFKIIAQDNDILEKNSIINQSFYVMWSEDKVHCLLNGDEYLSGQIISESGEHLFVISDFLGNQQQFTVTIDYTLPTAILVGVENGGRTNQTVTATFDNQYLATLNGRTYTSGSKIIEEGEYELIISNPIGNSNSYTFFIDKTAPKATVLGLNENNCSNTNVIFTFDEEDAVATLNGETYFSGIPITAQGNYILILKDLVGNESVFEFVILTTAPEGKLIGVDNYGYTNKIITFQFETDLTATLNGVNYKSNTPIKEDGEYEIILMDMAGNSNKYVFEIYTKKPEATFEGLNKYNLSNSEVIIHYSCTFCKVNNRIYTNTSIQSEGIYTVLLEDKYGNTNTYTFEIDKTAPEFEVVGVNDNGFTNKNSYITWKEENCTAYLNNSVYLSGTPVRSDGLYEFTLIDRAGNISTYKWERSSELPEGSFNQEFINPYFTNQDVSFSFDEEFTCTINGVLYTSGTLVSEEGEYVLQLQNKYGNINNYIFEIDRTAPDCLLQGVDPNGFTNKKVIIVTNENNLTIYVNDEIWTKDYVTLSYSESYNNFYNIKVMDKARNVTEFNFEYKYENLESYLLVETNEDSTSAIINYTDNYSCTLNGTIINSGQVIDEAGTYNLLLSDKYGNEYELKITIYSIPTPNYTFRNIATIISVLFISGIVIFVIVKKLKTQKGNPYKKSK